ncbi:MAG: acetylxylan esterase [Bacteroidales bacterium]|nr:acetylxylan esterase [Bacteroidales bacterium]
MSIAISGQAVKFVQSDESGLYAVGEMITVRLIGTGELTDSIAIRIIKNNDHIMEVKKILPSGGDIGIFSGSLREPCSLIFEARYKGGLSSLGLMAGAEIIRAGLEAPKDFNSYWKQQKKALRRVPLEIKSEDIISPDIEKDYTCTNIEINCPETNPARGYLVMPENPQARSMPIVLLVHAAGVSGHWCKSEPRNAMVYAKMGAICFDLNAHGMLNGQPDGYYNDLEKGELRGYWMKGVTNRDDYYFRGMYLRLIRTIDYLAALPWWDGKRILVIGESQGGGQALAAAGLDRRVNAAVAIVPAMCDWFGSLAGRRGGWPQPYESGDFKEEMKNTLPYFDAANLLKRSKATIFAEIGLIDMTCPATSVYAAINNSRGRKIIYTVPYRPHQQPHKDMLKIWEETVYKPREQFISDFLK